MKLNEKLICIYIYIKIDKILFPTGKYHINKLHVTHLKILKLQMDEPMPRVEVRKVSDEVFERSWQVLNIRRR